MSEYGVISAPNTVRLERTLPGPIDRVWAYLTESDKRGEWLAPGEMEVRSGGKFELRFNHSALTPHDEENPGAIPQVRRQHHLRRPRIEVRAAAPSFHYLATER